jgi:predicted lipoprotein with Yx(FWY)xxD motif
MRHFRIRALATVAVAAFALAACGSSSKAGSSDTTAPATTAAPDTTVAPAATDTTAAPAATASVKLATTPKLGKVLVDAKGMTLYRFDNDTVAGKSTCGPGQCASTWPAAIVTGTPTPAAGVTNLTTFTRDDGKTQLQIDGHPLYTFAGDSKPGDTNGQGILDKWYAVNGTGEKVGDDS